MNIWERKLIKKGWKFEEDNFKWLSPYTCCEYELEQAVKIEFNESIKFINIASYIVFGY